MVEPIGAARGGRAGLPEQSFRRAEFAPGEKHPRTFHGDEGPRIPPDNILFTGAPEHA